MKRRSFLGTVAAVFAGSQIPVEIKEPKGQQIRVVGKHGIELPDHPLNSLLEHGAMTPNQVRETLGFPLLP